jgi:hypothetical protein
MPLINASASAAACAKTQRRLPSATSVLSQRRSARRSVVPDFIGAGFIAEAKNTRTLLSEEREGEQIADYAQAARAMRVPLYIFTRVDTQVEDFFERAVAADRRRCGALLHCAELD